jgi:hypothetical protein
MNRLISSLQKKNQLSLSSLKQLYRGLAVRYHPDAPNGSENEFKRLQEEYAEALKHLLSHYLNIHEQTESPMTAREKFLRMLYIYSIMYGSSNSQMLLSRLIEFAFEYRESIGLLFEDYRKTIIPALRGKDYLTFTHRTHKIILSSVKTVAWLFENNWSFDRRLLKSYLDELSERAKKLDGNERNIVIGICRLLQQEAKAEPLSIVTIGPMISVARRR